MNPDEQLLLAIKLAPAIAIVVWIFFTIFKNGSSDDIRTGQDARPSSPEVQHLTITYQIPQYEDSPLPEGCKRVFRTHVAGVTHRNSDGTRRQAIIRKCSIGEKVDLVDEPDNKYDPNAIKVCRKNGEQLGYIPAGYACNWPSHCKAFIEGIGYPNKAEKPRTLGILLRIEVYPKPSPNAPTTAESK